MSSIGKTSCTVVATIALMVMHIHHAEAEVSHCKCPKGWLSNTTNVNGGPTPDKKCKKLACANISVAPLPANGTAVGAWGFTWGNGLWAWGTAANGGAAIGPGCGG